jgi:glycosyltransferase involved in cell wall biosynthesis
LIGASSPGETGELPLVSIVIPVYNGGNYLRLAIDSALGQSYPRFEVIVVNDGSTDGGATREIALSYGDRIRYIEKENGGVATALNEGIRQMRGEFFSWLSHDDLYYPDKLERQVAFHRSRGDAKTVVFSHEDLIDASGAITQKASLHEIDEERLYFRLIYDHFIGGCSLLVPKAAFDEAGLFDPRYRTVQDYDLWFRMIALGYRFAYLPMTSGMSRRHEGQDSRKLAALCREEQEAFFVELQERLPTELWIDRFDDKVAAFYWLARCFYRTGLREVCRYDIARGDAIARGARGTVMARPSFAKGLLLAQLGWFNAYRMTMRIKRAIARRLPRCKVKTTS